MPPICVCTGNRQLPSMNQRHHRPLSALVATLLGLGLATPPAQTQEAAAPPPPAPAEAKPADGQKEFSIPAQSLAKSLEAFSAQTGLDVAARSELLKGKSAPALSGSMSDAEALSKLLDGSRLGFTFSSPTAVAVTDKPAPSLESSATETLQETLVESARPAPAPRPAPVTVAPAPLLSAPEPVPLVIDDLPADYGRIESSTALFGNLPLIETPFSVGVIGQGIILERRAHTATEALRYEPSVSRQDSGGYYQRSDFTVRGFDYAPQNSYRIDGLPFHPFSEIPIDHMEQLEVLKGPAGLRFGFSPPGGAINFIRKRPTESPYRSVSTDIDTFGGFYSQIDLGDTFHYGDSGYGEPSAKNHWSKNPPAKSPVSTGPTFGHRTVIVGDEFDDFYDNAGGDRIMGSTYLEWKPNDDVRIWTSILGQSRTRANYGSVIVSPSGRIFDTGVGAHASQPWTFARQELLDFAAGAEIQLNETWKLVTASNAGEAIREGNHTYADQTYENGGFDIYAPGWETNRFGYWSHHSHFEAEFSTGELEHQLIIGGEFRRHTRGEPPVAANTVYLGTDNVFNRRQFPVNTSTPQGKIRTFNEADEFSFFLTDIVDLTDSLSVLGGLRYADINNGNIYDGNYAGSDLSPTAAVMFKPVAGFHTYISFTQGFSQGGVAPVNSVNEFEQMPPIESQQVEIGVKAELLEGRVYAEFAAFSIDQDLEYMDNSRVYVQDGVKTHEGIEFLVHGEVTDSIRAGASAMFLDTVQEDTGDLLLDGKKSYMAPDYQATAFVDWDVPGIKGLTLSANAVLVGRRHADYYEQFPLDNYVIFNTGAAYRFRAGDVGWTLRAYLENLTDERYFVGGYHFSGYGGLLDYGVPVNATFSVQMEF